MPKYIVTNGSNFQPFTYEELARPLQEMAEAHRATQDQYDALSMQTEALRRYITDNEGDKNAKALYDSYVNKLSALQNNLWTNGYTAGTRRDLSAAKNGYFSDIQRLGNAIKTRQESSLKWREAVKNDPTLVTSGDPGLDGLDVYLKDDLHGSEWYSYSGNKFAAEVGADAQTRMNELFEDIRNRIDVVKHPEMKGYLLEIIRNGATSQQVAKAGEIVRKAIADKATSLPVDNSTPEGVLANVLWNHLEGTGAKDKVSPYEYDRLVSKGIEGLSHSIGKPHIETKADLVWAANQEYNDWYRKEKQKREWAKKDAEDLANSLLGGNDVVDSTAEEVVGEGKEQAEKDTKIYAPNNAVTRIVRSGDDKGVEVSSNAQAAELVYSEALMRERLKDYGFDFRTEDNPYGILTPSKKYLKGKITRDNITYDVVYKPNKSVGGEKGVIMVKEESEPDYAYKYAPILTKQFKDDRKQYEETKKWYQENEPEIYKMAKKIKPDARQKEYEKYNESIDTPTTEFRNKVMNRPENSVGVDIRHTVANRAISDEMLKRLSTYISDSFTFNDKGEVIFDKDIARQNIGTTYGIHRVKSDGNISDESEDPSKVFSWKDGNITNLTHVYVSSSSILPIESSTMMPMAPYFIVRTKDGSSHSVSVEMLNSRTMLREFEKAQRALYDLYENGTWMSDAKFNETADLIASNLTKQLWDFLGYVGHPQVEGNTSSNNNN